MTLTNLPDGLRLQVALLGADKPNGAEAHSSGELKLSSSQVALSYRVGVCTSVDLGSAVFPHPDGRLSFLVIVNVIVFDTASSEQAESRTSLLDYAEAQPILASESNVSAHITSPGQGLQRDVTLFYASFVPTSACKFTYKCSASAAETRTVNDDVSPSFTVQRYGICIPSCSEFDMLRREKDKRAYLFQR